MDKFATKITASSSGLLNESYNTSSLYIKTDAKLRSENKQIHLDILKLKSDIAKIQQEQTKFEKETIHKFDQFDLFHIEEKFNMNKILSKIEERFNKLEEENKRLRKMIDEMPPARSKFM